MSSRCNAFPTVTASVVDRANLVTITIDLNAEVKKYQRQPVELEYLDKHSNVMSGPRTIMSRGSWSHVVSNATDA